MKLNRWLNEFAAKCHHHTHWLEGLEPYEGKLSRTVLRGGRAGNSPLPLGNIGCFSWATRAVIRAGACCRGRRKEESRKQKAEIPVDLPGNSTIHRALGQKARTLEW